MTSEDHSIWTLVPPSSGPEKQGKDGRASCARYVRHQNGGVRAFRSLAMASTARLIFVNDPAHDLGKAALMATGRKLVMHKASPLGIGLTVGVVLGLWHFCWATLVATGWAQRVVDFVFWIHFYKPILRVEPFNFGVAVLLVSITGLFGFIVGAVAAIAWNQFHRHPAEASR